MKRLHGLVIAFLLIAPAADGQIRLDDNGKLTLYGDLRFRFESDWDSRRPDGSLRDDRDRLRIRARVGLNWTPIDPVTVGFRLRTGDRTAQQSPHLTLHDFEGNDTGPRESENLCLSCYRCNSHKGPNIASIDPDTKELARLFHPRQNDWSEHFTWCRALIVGVTLIGRATVALLAMNHPDYVLLPESPIAERTFPP